VIANLASELGALTVAVVTKPFPFEGRRRTAQAERGLEELRDCVDSVITIPNERLLATIDRSTTMSDAFAAADDVLRQAIQGISDLVLVPGLINLDFADVTTVMSGMGLAIMGTGLGYGETKAVDAATAAISSPLLEDGSVEGARGVIINVTGGPDLSLAEANDATTIIHAAAHEDANIIFGAVVDPAMEGQVKITVIATGFGREGAEPASERANAKTPVDLQQYASWQQEEPLERTAAVPITVSRRPLIELPPPASSATDESLLDIDAAPELDLDMPAFLRQQAEG
jgi:cell division protein FtsZ